MTQFLEGVGVPCFDHAVPVRGKDPFAVLRDGSLDDHFTEKWQAFLQIEIGLPDLHFAVASGGDEFTGAGVVEGKRAAAMSGELLDLSTIVHLPEDQLSIFRGGANDIRVRSPGNGCDATAVSAQGVKLVSCEGLPHPRAAIAIASGKENAVRRIGEGGDPVGMLLDRLDLLPGLGVPELDEPGGAAEGHASQVETEAGRQDGVELAPVCHKHFSGGDIPGVGRARLAGNSATRHEILAGGVEGDRLGEAPGEGEDGGQFESVRIVEEDLLLSGDGEEGSPGAAGHVVNHRVAVRGYGRFEIEILRHGRRALGLGGGVDVQFCDLGAARLLRLGALVFQQASVNPGSHEIRVLLLEFVALRRHEGFGSLGDGSVDLGTCSITGIGDCPPGSAGHHPRKVGKVEVALLLVRIVAVQAGRLKDGQDVIVVGDLRGCLQGSEGRRTVDQGAGGTHD